MHIELGLSPSIVVIVKARNDTVQKREGAQKLQYNGLYVLLDNITQKLAILLPEDQSVFFIPNTDLSQYFWS